MTLQDPSRFRQGHRATSHEISYRQQAETYIANGVGSFCEKMENFPKYVSRQSLSRYLALYEIFKEALPVHGSMVECGVNWGGGLMLLAHLSSILEPVNIQRKIIGFDTFAGFPTIDQADTSGAHLNTELQQGGYAANSYDDLSECIDLYDRNRFIGHLPKVELVKGDACVEIPKYLEREPHTVVSLLHLDFDIYAPTKAAIEHFVPRMPKGGIIVFDELNNKSWPGETVAVLESLNINQLEIKRFPFEPHISYAKIGA